MWTVRITKGIVCVQTESLYLSGLRHRPPERGALQCQGCGTDAPLDFGDGVHDWFDSGASTNLEERRPGPRAGQPLSAVSLCISIEFVRYYVSDGNGDSHIILAIASLHMAYLHPQQRGIYTALGEYHYETGLPLLRANLPLINAKNCHALYSGSQLIVKYLFAAETEPQRFFFTKGTEILGLMKGAYRIRETYKEWLEKGSLSYLAGDIFKTTMVPLDSPFDSRFDWVSTQMRMLAADTDDISPSLEALRITRDMLALTVTSFTNPTMRKGLCQAWLAQVQPAYLEAVRRRRPDAVVVLAHYCLLLKQIDHDAFWYMRGWSTSLLSECAKSLDERWRSCIIWPMDVVGQPETGPPANCF